MIPIKHRKAPDFQVQFTWIESASNIGYVRFYACADKDVGGTDYFLTTQEVYARPIYTFLNGVDVDFDWEFKVPMTVAADDAIINITDYMTGGGAADDYVITVYRVDTGAAEHSIGTVTSENFAPAGNTYLRQCFRVSLTQTNFAVGEKLRLNITHGVAQAANRFWHNPAATTVDVYTSDLTFDVPFKVVI